MVVPHVMHSTRGFSFCKVPVYDDAMATLDSVIHTATRNPGRHDGLLRDQGALEEPHRYLAARTRWTGSWTIFPSVRRDHAIAALERPAIC